MKLGNLYLITSDEYKKKKLYKIGISKDPEKRLSNLQAGSPYTLYIYDFFQVYQSRVLERAVHEHYKEHRVIKEWFFVEDLEALYKMVLAHKRRMLEKYIETNRAKASPLDYMEKEYKATMNDYKNDFISREATIEILEDLIASMKDRTE